MYCFSQGWSVEYTLRAGFAGRTLRSIAHGCMGGVRKQSATLPSGWRDGFCTIGDLVASHGGPWSSSGAALTPIPGPSKQSPSSLFSDCSQFSSTCSSLPLVFGRSKVAC